MYFHNSFVVLLMLALLSKPTFAIYMSSTGRDTNDGSESSPVQTLTRALEIVEENGNIYLEPGMYKDAKNCNVSVEKAVNIRAKVETFPNQYKFLCKGLSRHFWIATDTNVGVHGVSVEAGRVPGILIIDGSVHVTNIIIESDLQGILWLDPTEIVNGNELKAVNATFIGGGSNIRKTTRGIGFECIMGNDFERYHRTALIHNCVFKNVQYALEAEECHTEAAGIPQTKVIVEESFFVSASTVLLSRSARFEWILTRIEAKQCKVGIESHSSSNVVLDAKSKIMCSDSLISITHN